MKKLIVFIWLACMGCMLSPDLMQNQVPCRIEVPEVVTKIEIKKPPFFPEQHPATTSKKASLAQLEKEKMYWDLIIKASKKYQVEPALIKAIIMAESSYNPKAESKVGAKGLMQLMPKTAASLGVKDIYDPSHNIDGGVKYIKYLLTKFNGNVELALAAYNAGIKNVKRYKGIPPFKSTRLYIKKVEIYHQYYRKQVAWKLGMA